MSGDKNCIKALVEVVGIIIGLACTIWGLVIAQGALTEYKKDNRLSAQIKIDEREARLYDKAKESDFLHSFWAYLPDNLTPREKIELRLRLLLYQRDDLNPGEIIKKKLKFEDAHDLDRILWAHDTFADPDFMRLREAYDYAEEMLFTAEGAHNAFVAGVLTKEDWKNTSTYIDNVGSHPLFIDAVCWGHDGANFSEAFAIMLKDKYMHNKELKDAAIEMYPEIINDKKWAFDMGERDVGKKQ
jgi:hypothetical protein